MLLEAIILGFVQGLTEFLPISSSAHLRILGEFLPSAEDPGAPVIPYLMGGGTDNKALATLGIAGYGFAPLRLPAALDFTGMFHGVDERVPIDALVFGQSVLTDLLRTY